MRGGGWRALSFPTTRRRRFRRVVGEKCCKNPGSWNPWESFGSEAAETGHHQPSQRCLLVMVEPGSLRCHQMMDGFQRGVGGERARATPPPLPHPLPSPTAFWNLHSGFNRKLGWGARLHAPGPLRSFVPSFALARPLNSSFHLSGAVGRYATVQPNLWEGCILNSFLKGKSC